MPSILKFQECVPSLLQLATNDQVFVVDLLAAEEGFGEYAFDVFSKKICGNTELLKV